MNRHVMNSAEGAAMRVTLDGMIAALADSDESAGKVGDQDVLCLIARLHEARSAAHAIETRNQEDTPYRGVRLVKR